MYGIAMLLATGCGATLYGTVRRTADRVPTLDVPTSGAHGGLRQGKAAALPRTVCRDDVRCLRPLLLRLRPLLLRHPWGLLLRRPGRGFCRAPQWT